MKFAFLVHPITAETRKLSNFDPNGQARRSWGHDLRNYCIQMHRGAIDVYRRAGRMPDDEVRVIDELTGLVTAQGIRSEGRLYEIPLEASEILASPSAAMAYCEEAIDQAACWGARIAGLGSLTGIIGGQGTYLAERSHIPVTTGDSLEVFAAIENLYQVCREIEIDLAAESVAVVGIPSGIASAAARILLPKCKRLKLVAMQASARAKRTAVEMGAELAPDLESALRDCRIVVAASSSGDTIDQRLLRPGAVVIDVAVPTDVRGDCCLREDTLIFSGGLTRIPKTMALDSSFLWFHHGMVPSCLAETMILALEERAECFSLGRSLGDEAIAEIGRLAKWHGFDFSRLFSFGLPIDEAALVRYRKAVARGKLVSSECVAIDLTSTNGAAEAANAPTRSTKDATKPPQIEELASRAEMLHARHIDPLLVAINARSKSTKTFIRGEGAYLWDDEQKPYLDFYAGGGSLNLGHNHPAVAAAIKQTLRDAAPGFVADAVNPLTTALAERLIALAPKNLEMVSFVNSGSEAVENALKLAMLATGRERVLHLNGACHGKSLGALAVSGERNQRRRLGLDFADARGVPAEDLVQLERELASRDYAALVLETIGVEAGMRSVSEKYLQAARDLCDKHGTLLVVDEAQTGLGRLGAMLSSERLGVLPDLVTLAKSLGGGMVPLGAILVSRDLWKRAYGTIHTNHLCHSTL
ncbi:MAG: aminotransferase class III-fold pyridoxal phosphate-dependent enzyme, partial [Planctomycetales bacterium]|nr:aminotransferase class III-fold pyridoxal phosphate-dependent enzyme [Planctomycetales bacterium]